MSKCIFILACIFSFQSFASCELVTNEYKYKMNGSGNVVAVYSEKLNCFAVFENNEKTTSFSINGLNEINDVPLQLTLEISHGGDFVLIGFNVAESSRIYQVYKVSSLKLVKEIYGTYATWRGDKSEIIYVPDYGVDELQTQKGLVIYSPIDSSESKILEEFYFFGSFIISSNQLIGKVAKNYNTPILPQLVKFDLSSDRTAVLKSH